MSNNKTEEQLNHFDPKMTVGDAMKVHPDVAQVFSSYNLTGCSSCSLSEMETIEQVCSGYGVPLDQLIESLNNLLED